MVVTWPLPKQAHDRVIVGTEVVRTVPMFNAWTIWWNAETLNSGNGWYWSQTYWDAPIFFPATNTFAFSEPQPITILVAPVFYATGSLALAMNVYAISSLILNGWFAELFCKWMGMRRLVSIGGGVAMLLLPVVHWQVGVAQLVPIWGVLWSWLLILRVRQAASDSAEYKQCISLGSQLGIATTLTWMSCVHHGLMAGLLIPLGLLSFGRLLFVPKLWGMFAIALLVFGALMFPTLSHLWQMVDEYKFTRTDQIIDQLSLQPRDYMQTYGRSLISTPQSWIDADWVRPGWYASPGVLKLILMLLGVGFGWRERQRPATMFLLIMVVAAFLLSLGSNIQLWNWHPWGTLREFVPGFRQIRSVYRFGYFFQMAVVLVAAGTIDRFWSFQATRGRHRWVLGCLIFAIGIAAALDPWPPGLRLGAFPQRPKSMDWIDTLRKPTQGSGVLCLPMSGGDDVRDYELTTEWMILGTYHRQRMVNGYSGFFPPTYFKLRDRIDEEGITGGVLKELAGKNVGYLVVDRRRYPVHFEGVWQQGGMRLIQLDDNSVDFDVYRIEEEN